MKSYFEDINEIKIGFIYTVYTGLYFILFLIELNRIRHLKILNYLANLSIHTWYR
jgi:hypothetical protein